MKTISIYLILLILNSSDGFNWINKAYYTDDQREIDIEYYSITENKVVEFKEYLLKEESDEKELLAHAFFYNGKLKRLVAYQSADTITQKEMEFLDLDELVKKRDSKGNIKTLSGPMDSTYSFYDTHGRKIRDSIPGSGYTMQHEIMYTYKVDSIFVETKYRNETKLLDKIFIVDSLGNWVKKIIVGSENRIREIEYSNQTIK